jgi:DNA mismatch repair protein MutL
MGGKISILDDRLIDKIAAGEVVEDPSSVVKELIENSIDANSDEIEVEVKEGGKSLIKVKDNGEGMSKDDAELAIKRHATSKIKCEDDLFAIKTLGFRGEALASMCAVSRFSLITRSKDDIKGTSVNIENNNILVKDSGAEKGTVIHVEDLFYNVPARKKFLKTIEYELANIIDIVTRYALAYPNKSFKLVSDGKVILNTIKTNNWINTIQAVYGSDTAKNMIKINYEDEIISIEGYIGKPIIARNDKLRQTIFLNGRYVKSKEICSAVKEGYHSLLFLDKEPVFVLSIKIDEKKVDVNVHPKKEIVKISGAKEITEKISHAINDLLKKSNLFVDASLEGSSAKPQSYYSMMRGKQTSLVFDDSFGDKVVSTGSVYENTKPILENKHIGPFKLLGQINKMYVIGENAEGLMIIDQHAAEERVNYEKLMKDLKDGAIKKQALIKPIIVETSAAEFEILMSFKEELNHCGFDIDEYGENNIVVRSIPFVFERPSKMLISDLVNELKEISNKKIHTEIEERIVRFSCRKSIKAGEEMTMKQIEELLTELDKCELPFTCPHGRPTIISVSLSEIEKKFKRTG